MATLTTGPRLGAPASTGFKLWARFSGAATIALETKLTTETTWTSQDSQAVETTKQNTVVLEATGLLPKTSYDYRILIDSVEAFTEETMTMPTDGRFILYQLSDIHRQAASANTTAWALSDWETNYKPLGIPAVFASTGDFIVLGVVSAVEAGALWATELAKHCGLGLLFSRVPVLYQFDDWDWAGNNSSNTAQSFSGEDNPLQAAYDVQDAFWRDRPQPASPSYAYSLEICGIPLIFGDSRSQRVPQTTRDPTEDNVLGDNGVGDPYGPAQTAWLKTTFQTYGRRALVLYFHGDTYMDQITELIIGGPARRDSVGIFYQKKRNEIIDEGMVGYGYETLNNLFVISGDDHRNVIFEGLNGEPTAFDTSRPAPPYRFPFKEIKTRGSTTIQPPGGSKFIFGSGRIFEQSIFTSPAAVLRMDITAGQGGTRATMRLTWTDVDTDLTVISELADAAPGDFYFNNGSFAAYQSSGIQQSGTQFFPPENSNEEKPTFSKAYIDDVNGTVHPREDIARDDYNRLRRLDDLDAIDRDELKHRHRPRTEGPPIPVR